MCDVHLVNNPTPLEAKDHFEIVTNSNDDISSSDEDSLYNENIEYVEESPHDSELVNLEVAEIVISKEEEIEDDNLREKLLNVHLLIANIEALKDNPIPTFEFLTKSSSTSPKSFLEETNTFENSLPEFENFYFDLEEISSSRVTLLMRSSAMNLPTSYLHRSMIVSTLGICPIRVSDFYSQLRKLISILNSGIRENPSSTTRVNLPVEDDHSLLLAYVVWIFLAYLTYPVIPPYLHSFGNEDTIFDPCIAINRFYSFKPGLSYRCGTFQKFNTHRSHLNESPMEILLPKDFILQVSISSASSGNHFPPTDRSDFTHEEFTDELAHIITPPKYDCFYFRNLPDPGELISILNSRIRKNLSTTCVNLPVEDDQSLLLAYVVWIFLVYLTIPGNLKTLAKGFYPPSLHFLSFSWESQGFWDCCEEWLWETWDVVGSVKVARRGSCRVGGKS
nr:hypothetical protein [Tanacetum cinerariifolium]